MRRLLPVILALVVVLPAAAAGGRTAHASFAYGRTGGTIAPFRVSIARDGTVTASGDIRKASLVRRVPVRTLNRLLARARAASFFAMPKYTRCPRSLPDFAAPFLRISISARSKTVTVRGDCRPRFTRLYRAVRAAASRQ
jgi:hypothetical protein